MTKKEIVKTISEEVDLTQLKTKEVVQKTFDAVIDTLVNQARSFIYTTAVPPAQAAVIQAALRVVRDEPWRRERVLELACDLSDRASCTKPMLSPYSLIWLNSSGV